MSQHPLNLPANLIAKPIRLRWDTRRRLVADRSADVQKRPDMSRAIGPPRPPLTPDRPAKQQVADIANLCKMRKCSGYPVAVIHPTVEPIPPCRSASPRDSRPGPDPPVEPATIASHKRNETISATRFRHPGRDAEAEVERSLRPRSNARDGPRPGRIG